MESQKWCMIVSLDSAEPTKEDIAVAKQIPEASIEEYENIARWFKHILSFSAEERYAHQFPDAFVLLCWCSFALLLVAESCHSSYVPGHRSRFPGDDAPAAAAKEEGGDDEFDADDLFGDDDDEDEEAYKLQQARAEAALKAKEERDAAKAASGKKKEEPKSQIIFDIKPWDDETNLDEMEKSVREIDIDGATWGAAKKVAIGYGIQKIQIICTILDNKVPSTEIIEERIVELEDYVQSVDVAAFNKL
uniref:Translation elongation factor EF1B beta/delta subunit guanine nucleotide exchange domain-containing protein n=1 Tax=Rhodosorus marinus TaxID=101924 RepID=A0A7S2ZXP8_9RHOD|mmetsp:Transcript_36961/g.147416  ORF Transcript_36961/g.147416 Transcript_36961/m.147416 type:complete len:248 (+) Transcript_36961:336-1079(+)